MDQLSVYLAIRPLIAGRSIVVLLPQNCVGPNFLLSMGAHHVTVVGSELAVLPSPLELVNLCSGIEDHSIDCVVCVENYIGRSDTEREGLYQRIQRMLAPRGVFAMSLPGESIGDSKLECSDGYASFWEIEEELKTAFAELRMFAQMPWQGFGFAPIEDERDLEQDPQQVYPPRNGVEVIEEMFVRSPETVQYLAIAGNDLRTNVCTWGTSLVALLEEDWQVQTNNPSPSEVQGLSVEVERLLDESSYWKSRAQTSEDGIGSASAELVKLRAQLIESQLDSKQDLEDVQLQVEGFLEENRVLKDELSVREDEILRLDQQLHESEDQRSVARQTLEEKGEEIARLLAEIGERKNEAQNLEQRLRYLSQQRMAEQREAKIKETEFFQLQLDLKEKANDLSRFVQQLQEIKDEELSIRKDLEVAESQKGRLVAELAERNTDIQRLEQKLRGLSAQNKNDLANLAQKEIEIRERENELCELKNQVDLLEQRLSDSLKEQESIGQEVKSIELENAQLQRRTGEYQSDIALLTQQLEELNEEKANIQRSFEEGEAAVAKRDAELKERENEVSLLSQRLQESNEQVVVVREEVEKRGPEIDELRKSVQERERELQQLEQGLQAAIEEKRIALGEVERNSTTIAELREECSSQANVIAELRIQLEKQVQLHHESTDLSERHAIEIEVLRNKVAKATSENQRLIRQLQSAEEVKKSSVEKYEQNDAELQRFRSEKERHIAELDKFKLEYRVQQKLVDHLQKQISILGDRSSKLEERLSEKTELAARLQGERDISSQRIAHLEHRLESHRTREFELELRAVQGDQHKKMVENLRESRDNLRNELTETEQHYAKKIEALESRLEQDKKKIERLEVSNSELQSHGEKDRTMRLELEKKIEALNEEVALQTRQFEDEQQTYEMLESASASANEARTSRLQLELNVRSSEQEYMLAKLEEAEQRIWEMTDESDRNAARLQASLCVLEQYREQLSEIRESIGSAETSQESSELISKEADSKELRLENESDNHKVPVGDRSNAQEKTELGRVVASGSRDQSAKEMGDTMIVAQTSLSSPVPMPTAVANQAIPSKVQKPRLGLRENSGVNGEVHLPMPANEGLEQGKRLLARPAPGQPDHLGNDEGTEKTSGGRLRVALIDVETWEEERSAREGQSG